MDIDEKLGKKSISTLRRVGTEDQVRAPRASKLLIAMPAFGLSIALVAYCFVNGHFFVGVWLATTFLAWAFLFGAANATDQSSRAGEFDGESRSNPSLRSGRRKSVSLRGIAPKRRSRAGGLKTGYRASVKTRLGVGSPRPGESIGSTYSLPPATTQKHQPGRLRLVSGQNEAMKTGEFAPDGSGSANPEDDGAIPADLKAAVALAAMRGDRSVGVLASRFGVLPGQVKQWKRQLIREANTVFRSPEDPSKERSIGA